MFIKQYEINLPVDYDVGLIRKRVEEKGSSFDAFPGLGLKCFLIQEKGRFGALRGQYAPVYLWPHEDLMWGFLAGPAFAAIKESFGTPPVATWPGLAFARAHGLDQFQTIRSVTRQLQTLSPATDLIDLVQREQDDAERAIARGEGLLARSVGLDPRSWSLVRFEFWNRAQSEPTPGVASYEVLHTAAPHLDALSTRAALPPRPS